MLSQPVNNRHAIKPPTPSFAFMVFMVIPLCCRHYFGYGLSSRLPGDGPASPQTLDSPTGTKSPALSKSPASSRFVALECKCRILGITGTGTNGMKIRLAEATKSAFLASKQRFRLLTFMAFGTGTYHLARQLLLVAAAGHAGNSMPP